MGKARAKYDKAVAKFNAKYRKVDDWHSELMMDYARADTAVKAAEAAHAKTSTNLFKARKALKEASEALTEGNIKLCRATRVLEAERAPADKVWSRERARIFKKYGA